MWDSHPHGVLTGVCHASGDSLVNPCYCGYDETSSKVVSHVSQWVGVGSEPITVRRAWLWGQSVTPLVMYLP